MSNDIVTRLRKAHDEAKHWIEGGRWSCPKTIHSEAADEIEYLRMEISEIKYEYQKLWEKHNKPMVY